MSSNQAALTVAQERHAERARLQTGFVVCGAWQSCVSCVDFVQGACERFKATPPPEVLVVGCQEWEMIPF